MIIIKTIKIKVSKYFVSFLKFLNTILIISFLITITWFLILNNLLYNFKDNLTLTMDDNTKQQPLHPDTNYKKFKYYFTTIKILYLINIIIFTKKRKLSITETLRKGVGTEKIYMQSYLGGLNNGI